MRHNKAIDLGNKVHVDRERLDSLLSDALDDLKRVKTYHPIGTPSVIKFTSYIAYWFSEHKPINIVLTDISDEKEKFKILNINDWFCTQYIFSMIFDTSDFFCKKYYKNKSFISDFEMAQDYLFYYLRYRNPSAKDIDAYMNALIIHPAYKFILNNVIKAYKILSKKVGYMAFCENSLSMLLTLFSINKGVKVDAATP